MNEIDTDSRLLPWHYLLTAVVIGVAVAVILIALDLGLQHRP